MNFIIRLDNVIKKSNSQNNKSYVIKPEKFDHKTAEELGYKNYLYEINGTEWGEGINILLVGSDKKFFIDSKARSDVIIILRINNKGKIISISIPRDTLITIKGGKWSGYKDKIGHSMYWEGLERLKKNVEDIINSPIYKVAVIDNFYNFELFLDIIGKVDINDFKKDTSISWIRNRNFKDGDIERCKRQQVFLKKSCIRLWEITKKGNYFYSNLIYDVLNKIIMTDLTKDEFKKILRHLKNNRFDPETDFYTGVMPGKFSKYDSKILKRNNLDCWVLDENVLNKIQFLFYSENTSLSFAKKPGYFNFIEADLKYCFENFYKNSIMGKK
ncbi:MAG: LCP family protein [Spirochaetes bacterium]|nr:LCP family protein [Spirochaetota bacterium]